MRRGDEGSYHDAERGVTRLRRQSHRIPVMVKAIKANPVMQPVRPTLPKLEHPRLHTISAPVRGPHDRLVTSCHLREALFQPCAVWYRLALRRGSRPDLAFHRPSGKV